ncbi:MAG TPA: deoxyribonuclease IV [Bacteroidota bacterium]|nr:deoxyribonuclease IV [Bacteroidota bacterium]
MKKKTTTPKSPIQSKQRVLVGAHQSIAGGMHKAFELGESIGQTALQVFTKSPNQWYAKPITDEDIANYKSAQSKANMDPVVAHACYLINMCASNKDILKKSREGYLDELKRCEAVGIPYLNFHPGGHMGQGEETGIKLIIETLNFAHEKTKGYKTKSVLETTAGQGTAIGYKFEHLRDIIDGVDEPDRMAVCIDTCHIFAAGYDISNKRAYEKTMKEFDDIIGLDRLVAIHANDSMKELGSKRDRHEHIGKGFIGLDGFACIMRDKRLAHIPKILETHKEPDLKLDKKNMSVLLSLM